MQNKILHPDYDNSILGIPNSILKYCGVEPFHKTNEVLDTYLQKGYKNVVVMLFDGMGIDCLENNIPKANSLFHANKKQDLSSVFLCTTTAATTSMTTGLAPIEHGWLGWSCYFKELDKLVNIFINDDGTKSDGVPVAEYSVAHKYMPLTEIFTLINEQGDGRRADSVSRYGTVKIEELDELFDKVKIMCKDNNRRFIYTYWNQPDGKMHVNGCHHKSIKAITADIQSRVKKLTDDVKDTLIIVTADHGLVDCKVEFMHNYPDILDCLRHPIGLEPRCLSFYVKEGMGEQFVRAFNKHFKGEFVLYTKDKFLQNKFMGKGKPHPKSLDFIGDYMAVAIGDTALWYENSGTRVFKALHAGFTEGEMMVPLIVLETSGRSPEPR